MTDGDGELDNGVTADAARAVRWARRSSFAPALDGLQLTQTRFGAQGSAANFQRQATGDSRESSNDEPIDYGLWPFGTGTGPPGPAPGQLRAYTSHPAITTMSRPPQNQRIRNEMLSYMQSCKMVPPPAPDEPSNTPSKPSRPGSQQMTRLTRHRRCITIEDEAALTIAAMFARGDEDDQSPTSESSTFGAQSRQQQSTDLVADTSQEEAVDGFSNPVLKKPSPHTKKSNRPRSQGSLGVERSSKRAPPSDPATSESYVDMMSKKFHNQSIETRLWLGGTLRSEEDLSDLSMFHNAHSRAMKPMDGPEDQSAKGLRVLSETMRLLQGGKKLTKAEIKKQAAVNAIKDELSGEFARRFSKVLRRESCAAATATLETDAKAAPGRKSRVGVDAESTAASESASKVGVDTEARAVSGRMSRGAANVGEAFPLGAQEAGNRVKQSHVQSFTAERTETATPHTIDASVAEDITVLEPVVRKASIAAVAKAKEAGFCVGGHAERPTRSQSHGRQDHPARMKAQSLAQHKADVRFFQALAQKATACDSPTRLQHYAELARVSCRTGKPPGSGLRGIPHLKM